MCGPWSFFFFPKIIHSGDPRTKSKNDILRNLMLDPMTYLNKYYLLNQYFFFSYENVLKSSLVPNIQYIG